MKIKIHYVILTWNSEKYIGSCLDSICGIEQTTNKIVVVDNGSTDTTCDIVETYVLRSSNNNLVKLIRLDNNYGTTISRNKGLNEIDDDTDYICILDSDTVVNQDAVLKMIDCLDSNPSNGLAGPEMTSSKYGIQMSGRRFPTATLKLCKACPIKSIQKYGEKLEKHNFDNSKSNHEVDYLMSACWIMKTDVYKKVGKFDENIFYAPEDVEYCIRVWINGYKVVFCPEAKIIHEWQRLSKKKIISRINFEHIKGLLYMFRKHKYFFSAKKISKADN